MRRARIFVFALLCATFTAVSAEAVTLKDIVDLTKAGLGDEVLIALIEVDGGVFDVDAATLSRLKVAGVSEKVIVALVKSGRVRPAPQEPPTLASVVAEQQEPQITYVERPSTTIVREVPVPVYVGVPVAVRGRHGRSSDHSDVDRSDAVHPSITAPPLLQSALPTYLTDTPPPPKNQQPEYWGFGGKRRPDAWKDK